MPSNLPTNIVSFIATTSHYKLCRTHPHFNILEGIKITERLSVNEHTLLRTAQRYQLQIATPSSNCDPNIGFTQILI